MLTRDQFVALLARLGGEGDPLSAEELRSLIAAIPEHAEDGELATIEAACQTLGEDDDTPIEVIRAAVEVVDASRTEADARYTAAEEEQAERDALRQRLAGEVAEGEAGEGDGEGGDAGDGEGTEGEGEGEGGDAGTGTEGEGGEGAEGEGDGEGAGAEGEPVGATAGGTPAGRPTPGTLRNRRTAGTPRPRTPQGRQHNLIRRDGGGEFADLMAVGEAMLDRRLSYLSARRGGEDKDTMASIVAEYPEDRQLDAMNPALNQARLSRVQNAVQDVAPEEFDAAVAAGAPCAPFTPYYGLQRLAEADRPFAAGLERFQVPRGGIIFRTPPDFPSFANAVDQWTWQDNEDALTDPDVRKPCMRVPCSETEEALIYAVTECLTFDNFLARTDPETNRNAVENTMAAFARKAEVLLIDAVKAASTAVTAGTALGAFRDLVYHWTVAAVGYRSRHRMRPNSVLELRIPAWTWDMMRLDLLRSLPGDGTLTAAEDLMNRALAAANLRVVSRFIDSPTTGTAQVFPTQVAGELLDFPATVQWGLSAPGSFFLLDQGRLDLGTIRDADLVASNDYKTFAETFEGVAFLGLEALWAESTVCPNGASSGTVDPADFCTGHYVPA